MALSEAILVCLNDRPMSGYDLAKNFDHSIGFFWRASHQQIYRELGKLRDKGLVKSEEVTQVGKPNRIVHTITSKGRKTLREWSEQPCALPYSKDDFLAKLYALDQMNLDAIKDQLTVRIDQRIAKLARLQKIQERFDKDTNPPDINRKGKLMLLHMGIEEEGQRITRLQNLMTKLAEL